jgi:tetratricopeptide (TPR) repeat protein
MKTKLDLEDIFGDFFGFPNSHSQEPRTAAEIRKNALLREFDRCIENQNKEEVADIVESYFPEVIKSGESRLIKSIAKAALSTGFPGLFYHVKIAYSQLRSLNDEEKAVLGLISYHNRGIQDSHISESKIYSWLSESFNYLKDIKQVIPEARLALSSIYAVERQTHHAIHKEILEPILESSAIANLHLGITYFNERYHKEAEDYFSKALSLDKKNAEAWLNLLRAKRIRGKENYRDFLLEVGQFCYETECKLTAEELQAELNKTKIGFPIYKVNPKELYKIVSD